MQQKHIAWYNSAQSTNDTQAYVTQMHNNLHQKHNDENFLVLRRWRMQTSCVSWAIGRASKKLLCKPQRLVHLWETEPDLDELQKTRPIENRSC